MRSNEIARKWAICSIRTRKTIFKQYLVTSPIANFQVFMPVAIFQEMAVVVQQLKTAATTLTKLTHL